MPARMGLRKFNVLEVLKIGPIPPKGWDFEDWIAGSVPISTGLFEPGLTSIKTPRIFHIKPNPAGFFQMIPLERSQSFFKGVIKKQFFAITRLQEGILGDGSIKLQ